MSAGQSLDFVRLIRTRECPPETDKIKQQSTPIYTALLMRTTPPRLRLTLGLGGNNVIGWRQYRDGILIGKEEEG